MYWRIRELESDIESLTADADAMIAMFECENRAATDREEELFQDLLDLIREKRAELKVLN